MLALGIVSLLCLDACALPSTRRLAIRAERLEADLRRAEGDLTAAEEHLRGRPTRAAAISSLAEARIQVEEAAERAPWRKKDIAEAQQRLKDADREMTERDFGAALFFSDRARRIADRIRAAAREAAEQEAEKPSLFERWSLW